MDQQRGPGIARNRSPSVLGGPLAVLKVVRRNKAPSPSSRAPRPGAHGPPRSRTYVLLPPIADRPLPGGLSPVLSRGSGIGPNGFALSSPVGHRIVPNSQIGDEGRDTSFQPPNEAAGSDSLGSRAWRGSADMGKADANLGRSQVNALQHAELRAAAFSRRRFAVGAET
jgi:hypothetical protein